MNKKQIKSRLYYLKKKIKDENISYSELAELQGLAKHINKNDVLLREWAGIPEGQD